MADWKDIPGYDGYQASDEGAVRRTFSPDKYHPPMATFGYDTGHGYKKTTLLVNGKKKRRYIHRLVAMAFHGEPADSSLQVAHNDGDRSNNIPSNLRWATRKENASDRLLHGTHARGDNCATSRLTWSDVNEIREMAGTQKDIAQRYGVHQSHISRIKTGNRNSWVMP